MSNNDPQRPFRNTTSQGERADVLKNDQRTTFHAFAQADAGGPRGRFTETEKATVVGSTASPSQYSAGPDWAQNDPVPQEPPLGFDINAVEPTGEFHEIQKSLGAAAAIPPTADAQAGAERSVVASSFPNDIETAPAKPKPTLKLKPWRK